MTTMKNWIRVALALSAAAIVPACGGSNGNDMTWVQVERLGRPAINEGLFVTNDFLNAVNSISPDQDGGRAGRPRVRRGRRDARSAGQHRHRARRAPLPPPATWSPR
jgi:hypothetical protein